MNALKTTSEWPHHQDKHGNWVPCASNPCKMHGGTEIMAKNPEEAFEKANSAFTEFIKKLNNAGIKLADRTQNDEDIIKELRDNNEYIDDNPRCFHVNDDVSAYDIAHALFPDADYGDKQTFGSSMACSIQVDRFYPSSKLCHACGHKYNGLRMSEREWTCEQCGTTHDRDVNAALNILDEALRLNRGGSKAEK